VDDDGHLHGHLVWPLSGLAEISKAGFIAAPMIIDLGEFDSEACASQRGRSPPEVDKKSRGDLLRFIVLDGLAKLTVLKGPEPAVMQQRGRRR
jgi:hypothetical protein